MIKSIQEDRKTFVYRFLEASIGLTSIGFLASLVLFSIFDATRSYVSIFLILYGLLWVLKLTLNTSYTVYSYKQLRRWESFDWDKFWTNTKRNWKSAVNQLESFKETYSKSGNWQLGMEKDLRGMKDIVGTKYADFAGIYQVNIFSIYNESAEVLLKSLKCIYDSKYDLDKLLVIVSQEARNGQHKNSLVRDRVAEQKWLHSEYISETDLKLVYSTKHYSQPKQKSKLDSYTKSEFADYKLAPKKLNIIFTEHPDGLVGEVKGKASNEDWGGRQASLFIKSKKIDPELVLVTSLDADSHISPYFYHNLSYRFCLSSDRLNIGYQPIHVYSNNFFQTGVWPRQVAAQTTLHNMSQLAIDNETSFFAIYSAPLVVLQQVNFWVREVIAEDSTLFIKCLAYFKGNFRAVPFYGEFAGDAVESDDYLDAVVIQYKQLLRWAWGGVEGFPYMIKKFFLEENTSKIDLRVRLKWSFLLFTNHVFWSSTPLIFSVGVLLPRLLGGDVFGATPVSQNLAIFSQYFSWLSFIFLAIFSYITFVYVGQKAEQTTGAKWYNWLALLAQCMFSPLIFFLMGFPALEAQLRGIFGRYLTYLVTPKK
ncbi:MAG: hypothetical protein AAGF07_02535 [Patescibacteria group bacterium]